MAKKGETNPNAGRKVGAATGLTRRLANELIDQGLAPLNVMIENMMFWHEAAGNLQERIKTEMEKFSADMTVDQIKAINDLMKNFITARNNSQACAVDAAPYCHPRLQAITLNQEKKTTLVIRADLAAPIPGKVEDRSYRENYTNVTPIKRTA